ncbi:MAG: Fic family protein [Nanoarchaeota archaeon]
MVYVYKKNVGNKSYYYLRASKRKKERVIAKDIAYLGSSIEEVKKNLEKLPKYAKDIRKAYKTIKNFTESNRYEENIREAKLKRDDFLDKEQLIKVEACKMHFNKEFNKKDELTKKEILKNFVVEFAFNTASIEGNTIKLNEARNLLEEGLTPKNKTLREIYDLQNTEKVFFDIFNNEEDLSHEIIQKVHSELMKNIDYRVGYRTEDVRVFKSNFDSTPAHYVQTDMNLLLKWLENNKDKLHPLVLGAVFHHKFERIHPFMDGNGRTGRILLNIILLRCKHPPIIIHRKEREEYLKVLRKADQSNLTDFKKEHYSELISFICDEMSYYWDLFL